MGIKLKTALIVTAMTLLPLAGTAPACAAVGVAFDFGNVAFAYRDGYWDSGHHWHRWAHRNDLLRYRARYHDHYYDWNHDRDHDHGWHR